MKTSIFLLSLRIALCLGLAACAPVGSLFVPAAPSLTVKQETALARQSFPLALQQLGGPYADAELQAYVEQLGLRLAKRSARPGLEWRFVVVDRSEPGLYVFPAGRVAISRGLLAGLKSREELLATLGHAVAHAVEAPFAGRPSYAVINTARDVLAAGEPIGARPDQPADRLAKALLERSYPVAEELVVAQVAGQYLEAAGFTGMNPGGMPVWCRAGEGGRSGHDHYDNLSRTHPCAALHHQPAAVARGEDREGAGGGAFTAKMARLRDAGAGYEVFATALRLESAGQRSEAINNYLQAAVAAPDEAAILVGTGLAYLRAGDLHSARLHLEKAVQIQPDYYRSLMGLGYIYLQKSRNADAERVLKQSVGLRPVTENIFLLAQGSEALGRRKSAATLYRTVVDTDRWGKFGKAAAARLKQLEMY